MGIFSKLKDAADVSPFETTMDWLYLIVAVIPPACESLGVLPTLNILLAELFPTDIRNISAGVVRAVAYLAAYCNMMAYPMISSANAFFELMLGYGTICAFMAMWAITTVKDVDNMSLVEIENSYRKQKADNTAEKGSKANKDSGLKSQELQESAPLLNN